jgi:cytochrome c-type biogenesis protein CcmH/NrfG
VIALDAATGTVLAAVIPVVIIQAVQLWQGRKVRQETRQTAEQYKPNGGSSLRDAIDRLEQMVRRLHDRHDTLAERITLIEDHVTRPKEGR